MGATIDIYGLYRHDSTIFENMQIPNGLDKSIEEAHIMMKCQDLEILYPDFDSLKAMIGIWSSMNIAKWTKLYGTMNYNYDPLHPFDVTETSITNKENETITNKTENKIKSEDETTKRNREYNEKISSIEAISSDRDETYSDSQTGKEENTENTTESNEQNVAAFNSSVAEPSTENSSIKGSAARKDKTENQNSNDTVNEDSTRNENSERTNNEESEYTKERENIANGASNEQMNESGMNNKYTKTVGNMGSNTFQDLIESERNILEFNIYEYIAESFKQTFCIMVY